MSAIITIEEAQAKPKKLIHQSALGQEIIITENQQTVAKLVNDQPNPGLGRGPITVVLNDDEGLAHFEEYMP